MKKTLFSLVLLGLVAFYAKAQTHVSPILPKPASIAWQDGQFTIPNELNVYGEESQSEISYFSREVLAVSGLKTKLTSDPSASQLILAVDSQLVKQPEGYQLIVTPENIQITGHDNAGVFYGLQSLIQLLYAGKENLAIPAQTINDAPAFSWRSYLIDEGRYFKGEKEVYEMLDEMAALKFNVLHWHLTDDGGWRIEIKKYPKLTEIGSKRKDTEIGTWGSGKTSGEPHDGFYTQEEVKRILRYARERHIKVVPEIEMPGHASAAIASYSWLGSSGEEIEVPVKFGKHYPTFNVANARVQQFLKEVVDEVLELFQTDVIHIGGDEVRFNEWENNDEINALKQKNNFSSYMDIQIDFTNKMSQYIQGKGARMMGWNEILGQVLHEDDNIHFDNPSQQVAGNVIVQYWKGDLQEIASAVSKGYDIVNSHHQYTYLDYTFDQIPFEKSYNFQPIPDNIPEELKHKIIGIGCQMWAEWAPTKKVVQKQTFPRLAAYAEVAWTPRELKDYDDFLSRLPYFLKRWDNKGILYTDVFAL